MRPQDRELEEIRRFLLAAPPPSEAWRGPARYEMKERLGEGAMAVVYRAWDRQLDRPVALKLLHADLPGRAGVVSRFEREVRCAASLAHPNVVRFLDAAEEDGRFYIVMELVEGAPFSDVLAGPRKDMSRRLALLEQAACGTQALHGLGIIHRDLKPANILVTRDDVAKVGDFGLAQWSDNETALTRTGAMIGTPLYMSPEQATGDSKLVSTRSDVYSLGVMLYEILTGRPPHAGPDLNRILLDIAKGEVVAPRQVDSTISPAVEAVALKALQRNPDDRYADAGEFARDLRRCLDQLRPEAPLRHPMREGVRRWLRNPVVRAGIPLALASLAVVVALQVRHAARERDLRETAGDEKKARLVTSAYHHLVVTTLDDMRELENRSHGKPGPSAGAALARIDAAARDVAMRHPRSQLPKAWTALARIQADPADRSAWDQLASAARGAGDDPLPRTLMARAQLNAFVSGIRFGDLTFGRRSMTGALTIGRKAEEARALAGTWIDEALKAPVVVDEGTELTAFARAARHVVMREWERAEVSLRDLEKHPLLAGDAANLRALALFELKRYDDAARVWERLGERGFLDALHRAAIALVARAVSLDATNSEADELYRRAVAHCETVVGRDTRAADTFDFCGTVLLRLGYVADEQGSDAGALYRKALERFDRAIAIKPDAPAFLVNRGVAHRFLADMSYRVAADPAPFHQNALRDCDKALDLDPAIAPARRCRGLAHYEQGRRTHSNRDEALGSYRKALADLDAAIRAAGELEDALPARASIHFAMSDLQSADRAAATEQIESGLRDLEGALHETPGDPDLLERQGWGYRMKARILMIHGGEAAEATAMALRLFDRALEKRPLVARMHYGRGQALLDRAEWRLSRQEADTESFDLAILSLDRTTRLRPGIAAMHCHLGRAYEGRARALLLLQRGNREDMERAREQYKIMLNLKPDFPNAEMYRRFNEGFD